MCGIVGVISKAPVNQLIYDALLLLQHRGQDAAGIVTMLDQKCFMQKARGVVRDVFRTRNMRALPGNVGLGQVRYPTAGNAYSVDVQVIERHEVGALQYGFRYGSYEQSIASIYTLPGSLPMAVDVGVDEGLRHESSVHCDALVSLPKTLLTDYVGSLSPALTRKLNEALRVALALE